MSAATVPVRSLCMVVLCCVVQMLELSKRTGCQLKNTSGHGLSYVCSGRHPFTPGPAGPAAGSERQILVAIDNCRVEQLVARYRVEMYGFACSSAISSLRRTVDWNLLLTAAAVTSLVRHVITVVSVHREPHPALFCLSSLVALTSANSGLY